LLHQSESKGALQRMELCSRSEAKACGSLHYFTGRPCKRGHIAPRFVSTFVCIECNQLAQVEWREKYPERYKIGNRLRTRAAYHRNREDRLARAKASRKRHLDKYLERGRAHYAANKNNEEWRQKRRAAVARHLKKYPERHCAKQNARRAMKLQAMPKWLTQKQRAEIKALYRKARELSTTTLFQWHVDHIIPLNGTNICGLHVPWNLQLLPAEINSSKGARY
jgi:hypothetical protein